MDELSGLLESFSSIRGLLHHWYQSKVWKESADDEFNRSLHERIPNAPTSNLGIPMDVLITRGSISVGFMANHRFTLLTWSPLLESACQSVDSAISRLQQLESRRRQPRGGTFAKEWRNRTGPHVSLCLCSRQQDGTAYSPGSTQQMRSKFPLSLAFGENLDIASSLTPSHFRRRYRAC